VTSLQRKVSTLFAGGHVAKVAGKPVPGFVGAVVRTNTRLLLSLDVGTHEAVWSPVAPAIRVCDAKNQLLSLQLASV
jgi:hypothetical protein